MLADRARIEQDAANDACVHGNVDGSAMLVSSVYPSFEGEIDNGPFLRLALTTGASTRLFQHLSGAKLEGLWRTGTVAISPPGSRGFATLGKTSTIGLAILPSLKAGEADLSLDHINALASDFQDDGLLVSIITALQYGVAIHGAATAFFDQGRALILQRLSELGGVRKDQRKSHPLSDARYRRLLEYVEDRLSYNLSVAQMAEIAGLDSSGFSRAMRARTGLTPYAWLTYCRMVRAKALLDAGSPVTQVAVQLGYENPGKFSDAFRRVTGLLPSKWKRIE